MGNDDTNYCFLAVFKEHNDKLEIMGEKEVAAGTIERYQTAYKHLQNFIRWQYKREDYLLRDVSFSFIKNFEFYMKTERDICFLRNT